MVAPLWAQVDSNTQDLGIMRLVQKAPLLSAQGTPTTIKSEAWQGQGMSIADLLATLPGIQSRRMGGMGSLQSISVRGVTGNKVLICLDGVPLGNGANSTVNLGAIDLNQLESIEVWKGQVPARFGGNALGGVINLVSKRGLKKQANLLLGYGSHHTGEAALSAFGELRDSVQWHSSLAWRFSDNDYDFLDRNGTEYNLDDDRWVKRRNAQYNELSGTHGWSWLKPSHTWRLMFSHAQEQGGSPGREDHQTKVSGFKQQWIQPRVQWLSNNFESPWQHEAEINTRIEKNILHWSNRLDALGYSYGSMEYQESGSVDLRIEPSYRLVYQSQDHWGGEWHLLAGHERLSPRQYPETDAQWKWDLDRSFARSAWEAFVDPLSWLSLNGIYHIGAFREHNPGGILQTTYIDTMQARTDYLWHQSAQAAMGFGAKNSPLRANISIGRHFRIPDLTERYSTHLGILPNYDLNPETGWNFEAATAAHIHNTTLRATAFRTEVNNGIVYVYAAGFAKPHNMGLNRTWGLELSLDSKPTSFAQFVLHGTWQDPRNLSAPKHYHNKLTPNEPKFSLSAESYFKLPWNLELNYRAEWKSTLYHDQANLMEIPPQDNHHLGVSWDIFTTARISLNATNLRGGDYQHIHSTYPTPGREIHLTWNQKI
ncbi:MAG: TonB-dependent receptor [Fibrobacter sp.]|nr:TonB-dependent receptor [Fibrobacter sp.]